MASNSISTLINEILRNPRSAEAWKEENWAELFKQARATGLLGRVGSSLLELHRDIHDLCPAPLQKHFEGAARVCRAQLSEVHREARHIDLALQSLDAPVVLLKGAGYALAGLPAARGRVFSDIDILVPKAKLEKAESLLTLNGWMISESSEYNQTYYRKWMHELPPMRHLQRGTTLDVHHTILPETARLRPDPAKLIADAVPIPGTKGLFVLSPVDRVLHSMTHLFMNEDMNHGLRDLSDLDLLLRDWGFHSEDWHRLVPRARELDLNRPLYYALGLLPSLFGTPVPEQVRQSLMRVAPATPLRQAMDWIWRQALVAPVQSKTRWSGNVALAALYLRGHWLRMPPLLLMRHLTIKALGLHKNRNQAIEQAAGTAN